MSRRWHAEEVLGVLARLPEGARPAEIDRAAGGTSGTQAIAQSCRVLANVGLLERLDGGEYRLTTIGRRHIGKEYRSGQSNGVRRRRSLWQRVWYIIRARRKFSVADLFELADLKAVDERKVRYYLTVLTRAGCIAPLARGERTPAGRIAKRWLLIADPGPAHPVWRPGRRELYDPNSGKVIYSAEAEAAA